MLSKLIMIGHFKDDLKNLHEQITASKFATQANRLVEVAGGNRCDAKQETFDNRVCFLLYFIFKFFFVRNYRNLQIHRVMC